MADLENSRRISYKATYNQISGTSVVDDDSVVRNPLPHRAVEKAAFVQSLRIREAELAAVREALAEADRGDDEASRARSEALFAITHLVADRTATSTLNHADKFSRIRLDVLVDIARAVIDRRRDTFSRAELLMSSIEAAHQEVLRAGRSQPKEPEPLTAGATTTLAGFPVRIDTVGREEVRTTTRFGVPVVISLGRRVRGRGRSGTTGSGREVREVTATIDLDASSPLAGELTGDLGGWPSRSPRGARVSREEILNWAQRDEPQKFSELAKLLAPYLGLTGERLRSPAVAGAIAGVLDDPAPTDNPETTEGAVDGFTSRMAIEPIGNLHLERIEMYPSGVERGELVHSLPLAPGETVNISHKEWSVTQREFEELVQDYFEGYSEEGVAEKTDIAMSSDSQSQHATALNIGASLSASYSSVTLSTSFGYTSSSNETLSKKDSRNHSMALTKKASSRTKRDHKVTFKVTSVTGSEDQSVRVLSNPSATDGMRLDYFQLARKWKVDLLRYGLRMTYDIVIPNPGSSISTLVQSVRELDALVDTPFAFDLELDDIFYNSQATDPHDISNYDELAAQYEADVTAPPEARQWVHVHKELAADVEDYDDAYFESLEFDVDPKYYVDRIVLHSNYSFENDDTRSFLRALDNSLQAGLAELVGQSAHLSFGYVYQYIYRYGIDVTLICRPKVQVLLDWRLTVWNEIRQAAETQYQKRIQLYRERRAKIVQQIADFDALTLRRMEQEEIMKGVLRWLLGPSFDLVPTDISGLFGADSNEPDIGNVLDPNRLSDGEWLHVMERGEFIKYLHNAIEWENVLFFTYPYFWDDTSTWAFKKYLFHPDPTHRKFLRSGAARVVLTIRPGFETSFTSLVESGSFGALPGTHPYVSIAQEINNFAQTNYPGFPPANPEQNARPLLYPEQRRVWREMQYLVQLLEACKAATGSYPVHDANNTLPVADLTPFLDGPITVDGTQFNGVNGYNSQANATQQILDPTIPGDALLPTYAAVPVNDTAWNNPYFYACPGVTGEYDLVSHGADGAPGGEDKDADISVTSEASLIATWYEYTPINALDIGVTMNPPNAVPPQPSPDIA